MHSLFHMYASDCSHLYDHCIQAISPLSEGHSTLPGAHETTGAVRNSPFQALPQPQLPQLTSGQHLLGTGPVLL